MRRTRWMRPRRNVALRDRGTARTADPPKPALVPRQARPPRQAAQGGGKEVTAGFKAGNDL